MLQKAMILAKATQIGPNNKHQYYNDKKNKDKSLADQKASIFLYANHDVATDIPDQENKVYRHMIINSVGLLVAQ